MITTVFFDMFNTLVDPHRELEVNEYSFLDISHDEWMGCVWDKELAKARGLGIVKTDYEIVERICQKLPFKVNAGDKERIRLARNERLKQALTDLRPGIEDAVKSLHDAGFKLCVISNADVADIHAWYLSPLNKYFDDAVFSCDVGLVKPDIRIYELALERMNVSAGDSIFVGDGGDGELMGAKHAGLVTVMTEQLMRWRDEVRYENLLYADHTVDDLRRLPELLRYLNIT